MVDNTGARRQKVRELVFRQLGEGLEEKTLYEQRYRFLWRGSERRVELVFGNVREMAADKRRALASPLRSSGAVGGRRAHGGGATRAYGRARADGA